MLGVDAVRVGVGVLADILCKREGFAASAPECLASSQSSTQLGHGDVALARTRGTELAVAERHCWRNVAELGHLCVCVCWRGAEGRLFWRQPIFRKSGRKVREELKWRRSQAEKESAPFGSSVVSTRLTPRARERERSR